MNRKLYNNDNNNNLLQAERHHDVRAIAALLVTWLAIMLLAMARANSLPGQPFTVAYIIHYNII